MAVYWSKKHGQWCSSLWLPRHSSLKAFCESRRIQLWATLPLGRWGCTPLCWACCFCLRQQTVRAWNKIHETKEAIGPFRSGTLNRSFRPRSNRQDNYKAAGVQKLSSVYLYLLCMFSILNLMVTFSRCKTASDSQTIPLPGDECERRGAGEWLAKRKRVAFHFAE